MFMIEIKEREGVVAPFPKALVERNSVMVEVFYMILISQKYDQKPTILKG
jgi:non-canonical (house-cleaning) NTP pyrophosphatase